MTSSVVSLFSHSHAIITTKIESQTVYYSAKTPHYNDDSGCNLNVYSCSFPCAYSYLPLRKIINNSKSCKANTMESRYIIVHIGLLMSLVDATQLSGNVASQDDQCPSWTRPVNTTDGKISCDCGDDIGGIISCDNNTKQVFVSHCYCVTYAKRYDLLVVGACPYSCFYRSATNGIKNRGVYLLPRNKSDLSDELCGQWNREKQMCGQCKEGFAPPVLAYELGCMECNVTESVSGALKFVAAGLLPPTILFFLVITIRLSINSPKLIGFIFFAQLVASAPMIYNVKNSVNGFNNTSIRSSMKIMLDIVWAFYGLFSLDFFYTILPSFCIPGVNTSGKLTLQLFIAVYPLLLTSFTYTLIELHARDVKIVVYLWKPFHKCFVHFRSEGNVQTTIVDAFATIFQLSYVKILIAGTDLIALTNLYNVFGDYFCSAYPYLSASKCFYRKNPWLLTSIIFLIIIILNIMVLPVILMLLYPMRCFRKCLGKLCCCRGRTHLMLQTFMECFHGYYRDGTNDTRDCRYMAGLYFLIRMVLCFLYAFATQLITFIPLASGIVVTCALFIAVLQPYKNQYKMNNITDPLFLFLGGLFGISCDWLYTGVTTHSHWVVIASCLCIAVIFVLPMIYIATIALRHLYGTTRVQMVIIAMRRICRRCRDWRERRRHNDNEDEQQIAQNPAVKNYGSMVDF